MAQVFIQRNYTGLRIRVYRIDVICSEKWSRDTTTKIQLIRRILRNGAHDHLLPSGGSSFEYARRGRRPGTEIRAGRPPSTSTANPVLPASRRGGAVIGERAGVGRGREDASVEEGSAGPAPAAATGPRLILGAKTLEGPSGGGGGGTGPGGAGASTGGAPR